MDVVNSDLELFEIIFDNLGDNLLGKSLRLTRVFVDSHPKMMYSAPLERIENDYALMLGYMRRGYADPQRDQVYENLIYRLYNFVADLYLTYKIKNVAFFTEVKRKSIIGYTFTNDFVKKTLEDFVTDTAMLSLEIKGKSIKRARDIYYIHNNFVQALFCHIVVSEQWSEGDAEFYTELLLSPSIDLIDACLITSALTLAVMNNMDINKFTVLMHTYLRAKDEALRQRALIGWVFALSSDMRIHTKFEELVLSAIKDKNVVSELVDLQKQIIFCLNAEKDNDKIQRDIIPDIIKNNNINVTRFGITEKDEDPMADVFDPGESDRAMEKMEESFQKMVDMQKEGSDIYFGGFSQMKNFPFFFNLANWFCPFYIEHPDIATARDKLKGTTLLTNILESGPFCDSDKYSFTLALSSIISRIPKDMREMLNSAEAIGSVFKSEEMQSATYIRRTILQDMYRFFRLYANREQIVNPFDVLNSIFIVDDIFDNTEVHNAIPDMCFFALKHKNREALSLLMDKYYDEKDPKSLLIHGLFALNFDNSPYTASKFFSDLVELEPENKRALSLLARSYFEAEDYEAAADSYEELLELCPNDSTIMLNYCVVLTKIKMYDTAINLLYKLNLEMPESMSVMRVLAWSLMGVGKLDRAEKEYQRILQSDEVEVGDWLNAGYCQWFMGNIEAAVEMFQNFLTLNMGEDSSPEGFSIADEFIKDFDFITEHNITDTECHLMIDLVHGIKD